MDLKTLLALFVLILVLGYTVLFLIHNKTDAFDRGGE